MQIRKISTEDWELLKAIRLEALSKSSEAFSSKYADAVQITEDEWKKQLTDANNSVFLAFDGEQPVGMARLSGNQPELSKNAAMIASVYVGEKMRGKGVGRALIGNVIAHAKTVEGLSRLQLSVRPYQRAAVNLYQSLGFKKVGTEGQGSELEIIYALEII
jgi:RimJ/RimL family protein N-acetyltransferase